jgi:hypothetical protein
MPVRVERFGDEAIIYATIIEPIEPEQDIAAMFAQFIPLRLTIPGHVALIIDLSEALDRTDSFGNLVRALAEASRGVQASKAADASGPPITIFVGTDSIVGLASQAMGQPPYGGVKGRLCVSRDEALTLARDLLAP